jgi:hypothetical protein
MGAGWRWSAIDTYQQGFRWSAVQARNTAPAYELLHRGERYELSARHTVNRDFRPFSDLGTDVELLSVERESPSLWWFPLSEH